MGADIHSHAEVFRDGAWHKASGGIFPTNLPEYPGHKPDLDAPFPDRSYRTFGFLAEVRDHNVSPISVPRGLPVDVSPQVSDDYGHVGSSDRNDHFAASWLTVAELLAHDYDHALSAEDETGPVTLRDYLDESFFERLTELAAIGEPELTRVVFWFDT